MTNDLTYADLREQPGNFFYGVDQHLAFFIKIYIVLFFLFLMVVLNVLKDYFLPNFSDSQFFSFLLLFAGL